MTSVVMPWRTFGSWRGSAKIISPEWLCRSMKPGATVMSVASIRRPAGHLIGRTVHDLQPAVPDADGRRESRIAAPVDDRPVLDQQVERLSSSVNRTVARTRRDAST